MEKTEQPVFTKELAAAKKKYISAADRKKYPQFADVVERLLLDNDLFLQQEGATEWRLLNNLDKNIMALRKDLASM